MNRSEQPITAVITCDALIPSAEATACLAESVARRLRIVPIGLERLENSATLIVGSAEPGNSLIRERLNRQLNDDIRTEFVRLDARDINETLSRCYQDRLSATDIFQICSPDTRDNQGSRELPDIAIRLLDALLVEAERLRASDIHVSPESGSVAVRFRVDGVLAPFKTLDGSLLAGLTVRIKILSALDIAETRLPQDGQFTQWINGHPVDFRVSTFPTISGENVVLRVMNVNTVHKSLESLGLPVATAQALLQALHQPHGMVIVCGPTGCGKTTTLYAMLAELDKLSLNIMTLEDPVEIRLSGIRQTSIDSARSLDYADGLRALLRQDPDVLILGEVRDSQSCLMMLRAVMTGHRVLSTVHATNALSALERLSELGAEVKLLASHLRVIASQRLIRLICSKCHGQCTACLACRETGYFGRKVVMEVLVISPSLAALIAAGATSDRLRDEALRAGFVGLHEQAQSLVMQGATTINELERVLGAKADLTTGSISLNVSTQGSEEHAVHDIN